jgi:hypothetical protein
MTQPHQQLITALSENSLLKAAVIMDGQGRVRARTGQASVLKNTSTIQIHTQNPEPNQRENIYMIAIENDILLVVFDESTDFERVRTAVDTLVKHLSTST